MSLLNTNFAALALGLLFVGACEKKAAAPKDEPAPAEVTTTQTESAEKTPEQKLQEEVEELAKQLDMPEDYMSQAESEINEENLEAELAKLEKELEAEVKAAGLTLPVPSSRAKASTAPQGAKPPTPVNKAPTPVKP